MRYLSVSDWIGLATAIGVALTAAFAGISACWVRRQGLMYGPAINIYISRAESERFPLLRLEIIPADKERFLIAKISAGRWGSARIVPAEYAQNSTGQPHPYPSETRLRSFRPAAGCTWLEAFVDCGRGRSATIRIHIASKADSKVRSRRKVRINKKD